MNDEPQMHRVMLTEAEHVTLKGVYLRAMSQDVEEGDLLKIFPEEIIFALVEKELIFFKGKEFFLTSSGHALARIIASEKAPFSKAIGKIPGPGKPGTN